MGVKIMLEIVLIGGVVGILIAVTIVLFAINSYQHRLERVALRQEGWERAQEARQQQWQVQQERREAELEKKIATQVQDVRNDWHAWTEQDVTRAAQLQQQYQSVVLRGSIEYELAHLPQTSEAALPTPDETHDKRPYEQAARLSNADLSGRDMSRRYLGNADLRGASLVNANLFMADLSGANLINANLSGADLSGANLSNADLRGAILIGANVLVTDMNDTILLGTNLRNARNLTMEQLNTAVYDRTTQFDIGPDVTLPRIPRIVERDVQTPALSQHETLPDTPHPLPIMPFTSDLNNSQEGRNGYNGHKDEFDTTIPMPQLKHRKHVKVS
jgi:uncharacterized protein YjbI with pentapeptide repeats